MDDNPNKPKAPIFTYFLCLLMLAVGIGSGVLASKLKPELFGLSKGAAAVQAETDALVAKVGKLISLPTDEKPTVATVTDASKVKEQSFFQNAKNDDRVLIYQKAAKAILYRPSTNIIVEVGAVNINNQAVKTPEPSVSPSASPKSSPVPEP